MFCFRHYRVYPHGSRLAVRMKVVPSLVGVGRVGNIISLHHLLDLSKEENLKKAHREVYFNARASGIVLLRKMLKRVSKRKLTLA